jgi:hypothetical protein
MKVPRKDLVYLFLQTKRNLPKPIRMLTINPADKKGINGRNPFTRSTRQIKVQEHMPQKNITITTSLIH